MLRLFNKSESLRCSKYKFPSLSMKASILYHSSECKTHYASLGLEPNATSKDIKSAYYDLSLKFHPDRNDGCALSTERFREITEAYEVLSNPEKRRMYDRDLNLSFYPYKRENAYSSRTDEYSNRHHSPPRTGRTRYYNYEEHFKQHYENYYKHKEAEQEQFRRRWEADRRYRYGDKHSWSKYRSAQREYGLRAQLRFLFQSKSFVYLTTFWMMLFLFSMISDDVDRPKKKSPPLYYETHNKKDSNPFYNKANTSEDKKE